MKTKIQETKAQRVIRKVMEAKAIRDAEKSIPEVVKTPRVKKEKVGEDLLDFIQETMKDSAEAHLEAWKDRYANYKKVADVRLDLRQHDTMGEIECAEDRLMRKLTPMESEFLVTRFNIEVAKQCINYINK
jgi:hypothetical protein